MRLIYITSKKETAGFFMSPLRAHKNSTKEVVTNFKLRDFNNFLLARILNLSATNDLDVS